MFEFLSELSLTDWVKYVVSLDEFKNSPAFVERFMSAVSRQYLSSTKAVQTSVGQVLTAENCVVTRTGLKRPSESYFKTVTLFDDLPTVKFENPKSVADSFLKALGVRDYVDLQVVFSRLADLKWDSDHVQLVKYLVSVQDKLSDGELGRLRLTSVFTKEQPELAADSTEKRPRFKASELYAPSETLRGLGLPIIDWPGKVKWRTGSDE
ncbi:hypothetical protein HK405_002411, partial [Cladochytrium tenue]